MLIDHVRLAAVCRCFRHGFSQPVGAEHSLHWAQLRQPRTFRLGTLYHVHTDGADGIHSVWDRCNRGLGLEGHS